MADVLLCLLRIPDCAMLTLYITLPRPLSLLFRQPAFHLTMTTDLTFR